MYLLRSPVGLDPPSFLQTKRKRRWTIHLKNYPKSISVPQNQNQTKQRKRRWASVMYLKTIQKPNSAPLPSTKPQHTPHSEVRLQTSTAPSEAQNDGARSLATFCSFQKETKGKGKGLNRRFERKGQALMPKTARDPREKELLGNCQALMDLKKNVFGCKQTVSAGNEGMTQKNHLPKPPGWCP